MKAVKFYAFTWLFLLAVVGVLYVTGLFNSVLMISFGFIFATLFLTGVAAVLPVWVDEHYSAKDQVRYVE